MSDGFPADNDTQFSSETLFFSCRGVPSSSIPYAGGAQGGGGGCKVPQRRAAQARQHAEESPNPHGHTQQPSQVQTEREKD